MQKTNGKLVNSAFYPKGIGKSSTSLPGWGSSEARSPVSGVRQQCVSSCFVEK